jgi:hypothetical protein
MRQFPPKFCFHENEVGQTANRPINFTNSEGGRLYGKVGETELELISFKQVIKA